MLLHMSAMLFQAVEDSIPLPFTETCGTLFARGANGATAAIAVVAPRATDVERTAPSPFMLEY